MPSGTCSENAPEPFGTIDTETFVLEPSYHNGFAPRDGEPLYPDLWNGVVGAWSPSLGPTGTMLMDHGPYKNHGTLTNMDPATDWVADGGKYALDFDGSNDYVLATDTGLPNNNKSKTVIGWFKTSAKKNYNVIVRYGEATNSRMFWMGINNIGQALVTQYGAAVVLSGDYADNKWHCLAVISVDNNYQIIMDGSSRVSGTMATNLTLTGYLSIGNSYSGGDQSGNEFNGQIDDIIIWSRVLTPNEVSRIYQLGPGGMFAMRQQSQKSTSELSRTFVKNNGEWKQTEEHYIKQNGVWVPTSPFIKSNNWR